MTTAKPVQLNLLGSFRLLVNQAPVSVPSQSRRVIGMLALVQGALTRSTLAGRLWGDCTQQRAQANLRTALWKIRQVPEQVLEEGEGSVCLSRAVSVDLWDVRRAASPCSFSEPFRDASLDSPDFGLLRMELLPDWDEDWLTMERELYRQERLHLLEHMARELSAAGRHREAVCASLAAVSIEPLRESAQAVAIEAHLAEGNASEAIRQYDRYADLLRSELGLTPSTRLEVLITSIDGWPDRRTRL